MLTRWGSEAGCYISSVGSSVLPARACHPDLFLKQPLTLNPHDVCFSYCVKLFTLCLFVPNWVSYVLDLFSAVRQDDLLSCVCLFRF